MYNITPRESLYCSFQFPRCFCRNVDPKHNSFSISPSLIIYPQSTMGSQRAPITPSRESENPGPWTPFLGPFVPFFSPLCLFPPRHEPRFTRYTYCPISIPFITVDRGRTSRNPLNYGPPQDAFPRALIVSLTLRKPRTKS